ncbi:uncharacterized protein LOC130974977 [Arachis stenosperma]|uniref:uncharacterized protein LOC130974977 n=1 Tax=Arachis stenosperma TaxID=217475 RepID=UPI0025ABB5DB|nr:uncharacterized protein LOC130974977 [Arachis stenosperma]
MNVVAPLEIQVFSELVNKARVVEECAEKVVLARDPRGGNNNRGRSKYFQLRGQSFKRDGQAPQDAQGGCFNCGLPGHMDRDCTHGRNPNASQNQQGRVFAVDASDAAKTDPLMRGIYLIGDKILVALYDTEASHSFIAFDNVEELGLRMSELAFYLDVHTPYQTVVTRLGYRQISFKIEDREFAHN